MRLYLHPRCLVGRVGFCGLFTLGLLHFQKSLFYVSSVQIFLVLVFCFARYIQFVGYVFSLRSLWIAWLLFVALFSALKKRHQIEKELWRIFWILRRQVEYYLFFGFSTYIFCILSLSLSLTSAYSFHRVGKKALFFLMFDCYCFTFMSCFA